jgi:hypothetical protein
LLIREQYSNRKEPYIASEKKKSAYPCFLRFKLVEVDEALSTLEAPPEALLTGLIAMPATTAAYVGNPPAAAAADRVFKGG